MDTTLNPLNICSDELIALFYINQVFQAWNKSDEAEVKSTRSDRI